MTNLHVHGAPHHHGWIACLLEDRAYLSLSLSFSFPVHHPLSTLPFVRQSRPLSPVSVVVSAVTCCRASSGVGATFVVCRVCNPNSSAQSVWLLILHHTCSDWSDASPLALPLQCRARPLQQQNQGRSNSSGKGNDAKGKSGKRGKKGKSKDAGALGWNQQTEAPVASSVTLSAPQSETSTTVGTIDTIEFASLDLCSQEIAKPRWIAFNVDTGACGTVLPIDADYACNNFSGPAGRNYKTATGDRDDFESDVSVFGGGYQ